MKVIYIAGPYRAPSEWEVRMNIREAEHHALMVWQYGAVALCPHKNTAGFGGAPGCIDDTWLQGDLELLKRCDALWAITGWRDSTGATREVEYAREHHIHCLFSIQEMIDFIQRDLEDVAGKDT